MLLDAGHNVFLIDLLNHARIPEISTRLDQNLQRHESGRGEFYREALPKPLHWLTSRAITVATVCLPGLPKISHGTCPGPISS